MDGLRKIGMEVLEPQGAFYVYPNVGKYGLSSEEFCERLLNEASVAIVPGTAFGDCGEGYARISYAYSVKHITEAYGCPVISLSMKDDNDIMPVSSLDLTSLSADAVSVSETEENYYTLSFKAEGGTGR